MKFSIFNEYGALNSKPVFQAFEDGIKQLGHSISYMDMNADVAVIWSLLFNGRMALNEQVYNHYKFTLNRPIIVLEVGCLKRGTTWKMGLNGLLYGCFGKYETTSDRRDKLEIELKPIKEFTIKEQVLICTQHKKSQSYNEHSDIPVDSWATRKIEYYKRIYPIVVVRPHPRCPVNLGYYNLLIRSPTKMFDVYNDVEFLNELEKTNLVVNFNSNPGILAAINGVPCDVHETSLAYPVSIQSSAVALDRKKLFVNDNVRNEWLNNLCYTEWTVEEISTGYPLSRLLESI